MGNMTISYDGLQLLPELLMQGRLPHLLRESTALLRNRTMRVRGLAAHMIGPFLPVALWQWVSELGRGYRPDIRDYTAIHADRVREFDLAGRAAARDLDFSYRPRKDGFEARLWVMRRNGDRGNYNKGSLADSGIDMRDPTADKRLVEFCLSVPMDQYLSNGKTRALARRALADRLPPAVLGSRRKGYQSADWYEGLTAARDAVVEEIARLEACDAAARVLDLARMKSLVENWPSSGWTDPQVMRPYRLALLRGLSAGHFLRKASGSNA
jgi:asparagine synthase (glutamine-hydrolysing)